MRTSPPGIDHDAVKAVANPKNPRNNRTKPEDGTAKTLKTAISAQP